MPKTVLAKANAMLKKLEASHGSEQLSNQIAGGTTDDLQLSFFQLDDPILEAIKDELLETDINTLTPIEALNKLNAIKNKLSNS